MREGGRAASKGVAYHLKRIGVSVLFSGAAVGVSHVVQATRAGAEFSMALIPVILVCLILKYPAFLFGPLYTRTTGESVVSGYARVGAWTLPLVGLSFLGVMFTVVAAVSMLAAAILAQTLGLGISITVLAIFLAVTATIVTLYLPFARFQSAMKFVFLFLVGASVLALLIALPSANAAAFSFSFSLSGLTGEQIFFIAALIGWMPAGLDLPMMHSQWLLASGKISTTEDNSIEDFNFGYLSTTFLAVLFVFIGAIFFFGEGVSMSASAGGFSKQLLDAYSSSLGELGGFVIGLTLFMAIFSTLLVVADGFPRVLSEVISKMTQKHSGDLRTDTVRHIKISSWLQLFGAVLILIWFSRSLTALVDFATIVSFFLAPVFAVLNHRLVKLSHFSDKHQISGCLLAWSAVGIGFFVIFTGYFIFLEA